MYLPISSIVRATPVDDPSVEVVCEGISLGGYYLINVNISASTITVARVVPKGNAPAIDVARVQVAPDLIDATRRLFGLVGVA